MPRDAGLPTEPPSSSTELDGDGVAAAPDVLITIEILEFNQRERSRGGHS